MRHFALSVVGPVVLTIVFLVAMEIRGNGDFAPGQGAAFARGTTWAFRSFGAALLGFVIWGTLRCRREATQFAFAVVSLSVSAFMMFLAFFSQMAP